MFFETNVRISRPIVGGLVLFILFAVAGMKYERSLAAASQWARVNIEILPGNASKLIDASSRSVVPVAILSSLDFDATTVNPASVRLAGAPITKGRDAQLSRGVFSDVNGDGRIDLVVFVSVYSLRLESGTSDALLTATTFGGESISGSQRVSFRGPDVQYSPLSATPSLDGTVSNSSPITINDSFIPPPPTTASPYPSDIIVSGQSAVTKFTVSISNYSHTFPDDVDILLVGPTGATCLLMSDCGGSTAISSPVNITFDDSAASSLPNNPDAPIATGTYKPTRGTNFAQDCANPLGDNCAPANFPSPAPSGPYGTTLSSFNGTNPNGTWKLYVIDDSSGDDGIISSGWSLTFNASPSKAIFDFDGDRKSDISVYRPSTGFWYIMNGSGGFTTQQFGNPGGQPDQPVPADYDGDGRTDIAVYRPSTGFWYITNSGTAGSYTTQQFGSPGDQPVPADYDGDGKADIAVYRPSTGFWYITNSSGGFTVQQFGNPGGQPDQPVPADYDGDGRADIAVYRPSTGFWYITNSGTAGSYTTQQFGSPGDVPVSADYDGDGKADIAVYRPSTGFWYIMNSGVFGSYTVQQFGSPGDIPVPADYDGDGRADIAVYRPSTGFWYITNSGTVGSYTVQQFGGPGYLALPAR